MKTILVVANETLGGAKLFEHVKSHVDAADGDARVVVCVPRTRPKHGNIIYEDFVYDAAKVRIDLARRFLRDAGIQAIGDIGDPDPYSATMDAIGEHSPDLVVISTLPATVSGWLRRDLIERVSDSTRVPVEHVEVDLDAEGLPFDVTLVVAARTASGDRLHSHLVEMAKASGDRQRMFIVVVPQEGGEGGAAAKARARMAQSVDRMLAEGLLAAGMAADPDPYTATMNALQVFRVDDIVISTLPGTRSGWLRADLLERVRRVTNKPVEHVEAPEPASSTA